MQLHWTFTQDWREYKAGTVVDLLKIRPDGWLMVDAWGNYFVIANVNVLAAA